MANPKVSVIIPTHNRPEMLVRALHSVFAQTYKNIEVVVVNDASTDNTLDVLSTINDARMVVISNAASRGACAARNKGIHAASGDFVTFLDDDDEYLPHRITDFVQNYDSSYAYISCGYRIIKPGGSTHDVCFTNTEVKLNDVLYEQVVGTMLMTTKANLEKIGGFDERLPSSQDYDLVINITHQLGHGKYLKKIGALIHTEHELERITTSSKKAKGHWMVYKKYKHLFNRSQKGFKLYELLVYKNKKITLKLIFLLVPSFYRKRAFKTFLGQLFPSLKRWFFNIKGHFSR